MTTKIKETSKNFCNFSVIVCAFNEERFILDCLYSLVSLNYPKDSYEILVIENDSQDSTYEIVKEYINSQINNPLLIRALRKKHGGLSESRNVGIIESNFPYLAFTDADAIADKNWLSELNTVFQKGAAITGGRIMLWNSKNSVSKFMHTARHHQCFDLDKPLETFIGCNMAMSKKLLKKYKGFLENFTSRGDDTSFIHKIDLNKYRYIGASDAIVFHWRPENFLQYFISEWKSGLTTSLSILLLHKHVSFQFVASLLEKAILSLLLPSVAIFFYDSRYGSILFSISLLALIRRLAFRYSSRLIIANLYQEFKSIYPILKYIWIEILFAPIQVISCFLGFLKHWNVSELEPMSTPFVILDKCSNR